MNSQLHQYPSALYSSVSEIGYRGERFTGEVLRSGSGWAARGTHRRSLLSRVQFALTGRHHGRPAAHQQTPAAGRRTVIKPVPRAHAR
ncbi:MAG TPA: hypothetical protein VHX15_15125 [Frankiaceae bacterium]|jgi:hypothetical protein|nr:hypothetical protein [Frankiaceae bacterium]